MAVIQNLGDEETKILISQKQLENSWAGMIGKFLEPAIEPLGYDWKIGIALITSFAAREVFVGTMATIYSIAQDDEGGTLREKMKNEKAGWNQAHVRCSYSPFAAGILCICLTVYEYIGGNQKRNRFVEMACNSIFIYGISGICGCLGRLFPVLLEIFSFII